MKQPSPFLIPGGPAEADLVAFDRIPPHEQQEPVIVLGAAAQLVTTVPRHRRDDGFCDLESSPERCGLTVLHVEYRNLEDRIFRRCHGSVQRLGPPHPPSSARSYSAPPARGGGVSSSRASR